jgi:hypothetical protein
MSSSAGDCEVPGDAGDITDKETEIGILPSHGKKEVQRETPLITVSPGIALALPDDAEPLRPSIVQHL